VKIMLASRPSWFRGVQMGLTALGTLVAFVSILMGVALVDYRRWAPGAAAMTFAMLLALDVAAFSTALYTGPLLRALYLWNVLLWFCIHLSLALGAFVGRQAARATPSPGAPAVA